MILNRWLKGHRCSVLFVPAAWLMAALATFPSAAMDLNGYWVVRTPASAGVSRETFFHFVEQSGKLSGNVSFPFGDFPIEKGISSAERFQFSVPYAPGVVEEFTGTYQGDKFKLTSEAKGRPASWGEGEPTTATAMAPPQRLALPALRDLPSNGLAPTPPMGWSSWNHFQDKVDDAVIRQTADALVKSGMRDVGYKYVNIDDTWQGTRDAAGTLHPNAKFPDMTALAGYVHGLGLKLGIYTAAGPKSCGGYEGSYGHEEQDAKTFATWGVDFVKYDFCSVNRIYRVEEARAVAQKMAEKLRATGRPMVFSLSVGPDATPWTWGKSSGANLWRTTGNIKDSWDSMSEIGFGQGNLAGSSEPNHWNDPDMLEVGNGGMSPEEYRTHISLWAMLAAPLLAGNDVRSMEADTLASLTNSEVIAIDQDPLGKAAFRIAHLGPLEIWIRSLANDGLAVAWFNTSEAAKLVSANWNDIGVADTAKVRDLWRHLDLPSHPTDLVLQPHGVAMFRVTPH